MKTKKPEELDPKKLEVGDVVQYEEKYHGASVIKITMDLSDSTFLEYEAEILEPIYGSQEKGSKFTFGHSLKEEYQSMVGVYVEWKVKTVGEPTDYIRTTEDVSADDFDRYLKSLKEKYSEKV